ncbi:MAG: glutamate synthase subunit alpha, partial [Pseudomonadota bacterium]
MTQFDSTRPGGLYDPATEHDACGVGFVVDIKGRRSHTLVEQGLTILKNLQHRGACGCEENTGDGAGILIQIPHAFLARECEKLGVKLPVAGEYGTGLVFLPRDPGQRAACEKLFEAIVREESQVVLGWRDVPVDDAALGPSARVCEPVFRQIFIGRGGSVKDAALFELKLYVIRKRIEHAVANSAIAERNLFYIPSLSARTIVYKGMLTPDQVEQMFPDLRDPLLDSALALVHSRFSTNTFPSWPLAHPFRFIAHNGEINTLRGNINWMRARERLFKCSHFTDAELARIIPVLNDQGSDSAIFDNALEMLVMSGRSLPHAVMMLIPEAWAQHQTMSRE